MRRVWMCVLLLAAMAGSAVADGPETGLVSGVVTDASGTPLPGVSVIITGDRGEKATVTGEDGSYRFALLVPGSYVIKAELEGMGTADETAQVTAGQRSEINLTLKLETAETITVTDEAPHGGQVQRRRGRDHAERRRHRGHRREPHLLRRRQLHARRHQRGREHRPLLDAPEHQRRHLGRLDRLHRRRRHHLLPLRRHPRVPAVVGHHRGEPRVRRSGRRLRPHRRLGDQRHRQVRHQQLPRRPGLQPHRGGVELRVPEPAGDLAARVESRSRRGSSSAPRWRRRTTTTSTRPPSAARSSATRPGSSSRSTSRTPTPPARPSTATSSTRAATSSRASRRSTSSPRPSTRCR